MLLRLALETASFHAAADDDRLDGLAITSIEGYRSFLTRVYGFEAPVERALRRIAGSLGPAFVHERLRVPRLREDMIAAGVRPTQFATIPLCTAITITTPAQALGWMFVLERHMLLAGQIARHIERTLGARVVRATRYFNAYGTTPGAKFRELGKALGIFAQQHAPGLIVAGAQDAFRAQRAWYRPQASEHSLTERLAEPTSAPRKEPISSIGGQPTLRILRDAR